MTKSPAEFSAAETALLARFFTNMDRPVFALRNLPEVVKGALFSRYSRDVYKRQVFSWFSRFPTLIMSAA